MVIGTNLEHSSTHLSSAHVKIQLSHKVVNFREQKGSEDANTAVVLGTPR